MNKTKVTLGGVPISANGSVVWKLVSGIQPYQTAFSCHEAHWESIRSNMGVPLTMRVQTTRSTLEIKSVFVLYELPSDSPNRRSFLVSDRRWRWEYRLVTKDYNMVRRTGDKTLIGAQAVEAPIELAQQKDSYFYLPYSLDGDKRWTPRRMLEDVFKYVEPYKDSRVVESFPPFGQDVGGRKDDVGGITIQNMLLRDQGNIAMLKALQSCPGADVYVRYDGKVAIFDSTSEVKTRQAWTDAGPATWDGQRVVNTRKESVRPKSVAVHFQREVELVLEYEDNFPAAGSTVETTKRDKNAPFVENVMPTVDPETSVTEYDPVQDKMVSKTVGMGTYVEFKALLKAWDDKKPQGSMPWTFDTISKHWLHGDLDGALGNKGLDLDPKGNVSARVQMIKQHFRQTFRVNQRIMERVRDIQPIRVFTLDPVTGLRAPSLVWGQACVVPTTKGHLMASRTDPDKAKVYLNVDYYPGEERETVETPPGPTRLMLVDRDRGIFRIEWIESPYGTVSSFVPSLLCDVHGTPKVLMRDLKAQDREPVITGARKYDASNGIFLANSCKMKMIVTMVPCAPNDSRQFHTEYIDPEKIDEQFQASFTMTNGRAPDYHVFIPPNEVAARFGWLKDKDARETALKLLGLYDDPETREDESEAGPEGAGIKDDPATKNKDESASPDLPGYEFINYKAYIAAYAETAAAEILVPFSDSVNGTLVTDMSPKSTLKGRMTGLSMVVAGAPSGKVQSVFEFPGAARPIDSKALLPMDARMLIMGIVPFSK